MCQRRINVKRFLSNALLTLRRLRLQCPHVMRSIRQLNEHHADILAHRQNHFSDGLCLLFHARRKIQPPKFGHAVHQQRNFLTKLLLNDFQRHIFAVFHRVMKQSRCNRRRVKHQFG